MPSPGSGEGLFGVARLYLEFAFENPRLYELMLRGRPPLDQGDMRGGSGSPPDCFLALIDAVKQAQDLGVLSRNLSPYRLAYSIWGQVHGIASLSIAKQFAWIPETDIPQLFNESARAIISGFASSRA